MRMTQYIGLTGEAQKFLDNNAKRMAVNICQSCMRADMAIKKEVYSKTFGMGEEVIPLYKYDLGNKEAIEVVQCSPWSSGPVIFIMLEVYLIGEKNESKEGKIVEPLEVFEWSDEEIEKYL